MSGKQSNDVVFSFQIGDLGKIKDRRTCEREQKFIRERLQEWGVSPDQKVSMSSGELEAIITKQDSAQYLVEWADKIGAILKSEQLSTSQIRNVFGEVRDIDNRGFDDPKNQRRFILIKPKLAYIAGKESKNKGLADLRDILTASIDEVIKTDNPDERKDNFRRFVDFFEAILAYHKAYGGN